MAGKNQHYVPQYYLRNFSIDDKVYVYDKDRKCYLGNSRIGIDKIAFSKHFYNDLDNSLGKYLNDDQLTLTYIDDLIEKYNERVSSPLVKSFVDLGEKMYRIKNSEIFSAIRTDDVIDLIVVQLFRTPWFRKQFEFTANKIYEKYKDFPNLGQHTNSNRLSQTVHNLYILSSLVNTSIWKHYKLDDPFKPEFKFIHLEVKEIIDQIKAMSKSLWISTVDDVFITGDNPVWLKRNERQDISMLTYPITKRCLFIFSLINDHDRSIHTINEGRNFLLKQQNRTIFENSLRFIYSTNNTGNYLEMK